METSATTPGPLPAAVSSEEKILAVICHASVLLGGLGFLVVPLVIFLVKRESSPFVTFHAREALNFHLSILLYVVCTLPFLFLFACLFILVGVPLYSVLGLVTLIFAIVASVRASEGALYRYPLTIRLV